MSTPAEQLVSFGVSLQNPSLLTAQGLIGGQWRDAPSEKTFPVYEPASGEVLLNCSNFGLDDMVEAITKAEPAQKQFYSTTTGKQRGTLLRKWYDLIIQNSKDRKSPSTGNCGCSRVQTR